jgi:hypothetical protein
MSSSLVQLSQFWDMTEAEPAVAMFPYIFHNPFLVCSDVDLFEEFVRDFVFRMKMQKAVKVDG